MYRHASECVSLSKRFSNLLNVMLDSASNDHSRVTQRAVWLIPGRIRSKHRIGSHWTPCDGTQNNVRVFGKNALFNQRTDSLFKQNNETWKQLHLCGLCVRLVHCDLPWGLRRLSHWSGLVSYWMFTSCQPRRVATSGPSVKDPVC